MTVEQTLADMGLSLPNVATPLASYVPALRSGNLVYVSGQVPVVDGAIRYAGSVGDEVSEDDAYDGARIACLNCLAAVKSVIGDLDKVSRVVKVTGYVNSALGYTNQPVVVNGASDLLGTLFGDAGKHTRVAVGVYELPLDATVEIEMIVEIAD